MDTDMKTAVSTSAFKGANEMTSYETKLRTKFRDMSEQQRERWINWCFTHDWCVSAGQNGCREFFVEDTAGETHKFETPRDLRNWAGY